MLVQDPVRRNRLRLRFRFLIFLLLFPVRNLLVLRRFPVRHQNLIVPFFLYSIYCFILFSNSFKYALNSFIGLVTATLPERANSRIPKGFSFSNKTCVSALCPVFSMTIKSGSTVRILALFSLTTCSTFLDLSSVVFILYKAIS